MTIHGEPTARGPRARQFRMPEPSVEFANVAVFPHSLHSPSDTGPSAGSIIQWWTHSRLSREGPRFATCYRPLSKSPIVVVRTPTLPGLDTPWSGVGHPTV